MTPPFALAIAGPTASGKSALALALARKTGGGIVSCDSMQIYRGMDIGTAKPSPAEMRRVPHRLIDIREPDEPFSAEDYRDEAMRAIRRVTETVSGDIVTTKIEVAFGSWANRGSLTYQPVNRDLGA